jgi:hypothetical protein
MSKIIFAYRLKSDTGFAPCVDNNIFTLACCKGGHIRNGNNIKTGLRYKIGEHKEKNPNDEIYLIGIYKNKLLYCAIATEIIKMTDYFSQEKKSEYGKRKDQIYDIENGEPKRNNYLPNIHRKGDPQNKKDVNGVYVIVSDKFTYFGTNAPIIPDAILSYLPRNREYKTISESKPEFYDIYSYLKSTIVVCHGVVGAPHDKLNQKECGVRNENHTIKKRL